MGFFIFSDHGFFFLALLKVLRIERKQLCGHILLLPVRRSVISHFSFYKYWFQQPVVICNVETENKSY